MEKVYNIMIKTGGTELTNGTFKFLTQTMDGQTSVRQFESKATIDAWIEKVLNEGKYKKTDLLIVSTDTFNVLSNFYENDKDDPTSGSNGSNSNGSNSDNDDKFVEL